uniref:Uncharacterized protein n=1 Tax=Arundo donax TaxID=35708 RepID=A0A0A9DKY4_ARUDO
MRGQHRLSSSTAFKRRHGLKVFWPERSLIRRTATTQDSKDVLKSSQRTKALVGAFRRACCGRQCPAMELRALAAVGPAVAEKGAGEPWRTACEVGGCTAPAPRG